MAVRVAIPLAVDELRRLGVPMVLVSEREIAHAVRDYAAAGHPSGGLGRGLAGGATGTGRRPEPVVLIVTGRNIDDELHRRCVEDPDSFPD